MRPSTQQFFMATSAFLLLAASAQAQSKPALANDQPIEISADTLDVHQDEHKAIFTGNVIAVQGTTTLRSKVMTAFYNQENDAAAPAKPVAEAGAPPGISRIEAQGAVVFTTPTETAQGDFGTYNATDDTIVLTGGNVVLTRDKNVIKGQKLVYNMATGRSTLTAGGAPVSEGASVKSGRVHGLFVPKSDKPK